MAIRQIEQVSCSMNLGMIYDLQYEWTPQNGVAMTLYFVNKDGIYNKPNLLPLTKQSVKIGNTSFALYPVSYDIQLRSGRRVISVDFVDEFFMLDKYYVVLTGRGCGTNVFQLGLPVDNRTTEQKVADSLDPDAQQIADLTQFPDIEYSFNDFLALLRTKFNVQVTGSYDGTITRGDIVGTFREVLTEWCNFYNLSFFFENSIIKIFDPTTIALTLPSAPTDALEYDEREDITDTYGKTVFNWFQQGGGEFNLNQTSNSDGPLYVRTATLYPVGYEFNLPQQPMDLNQLAAAQYGEQFWVVYNYVKGGLDQCGLVKLNYSTPVQGSPASLRGASALGASVYTWTTDKFNGQFNAYQQYGEKIGPRLYLSNAKTDLAIDQTYTWFDEAEGQIFDFTNVTDKSINPTYLTPVGAGLNIVPDTTFPPYYSGVNYVGDRIAYEDTAKFGVPPLSTTLQAQVNAAYNSIFIKQSDAADFSDLVTAYGQNNYTAINDYASIPSDLITFIDQTLPSDSVITGVKPRFTSIPIKGISRSDYSTLKATQNETEGIEIVNGLEGGNVVSNTAVIKAIKDGAYRVYYDKYQTCASASTPDQYFGYRFAPRQISDDIAVSFTFNKPANNTYELNRDYATLDSLINNSNLQSLAQARTFPTRRISFSTNYFYQVPLNFLTNGLIGMSMSMSDNGIQASYTFSNEILAVAGSAREQQALTNATRYEQSIRNSWIRQYNPQQTIS